MTHPVLRRNAYLPRDDLTRSTPLSVVASNTPGVEFITSHILE